MNNIEKRHELKSMLQELIPHIKGKWFIGKGALLGIIREHDLILEDHDIDIYLLPNSSIDLPKNWGKQNYYMDTKYYKLANQKIKLNTWNEYCRFTKTIYQNLNRPQIFKKAKETYYLDKIIPTFTEPFIDVYKLNKKNERYEIPYWTQYFGSYFSIEEVENIKSTNVLGFDVNIPNNPCDVLCRHFGNDWNIPNKNYRKKLNK